MDEILPGAAPEDYFYGFGDCNFCFIFLVIRLVEMTTLLDYFVNMFTLMEVKAEENGRRSSVDGRGQTTEERKQSGTWPRRLSFTPFPKSCREDEDALHPEDTAVMDDLPEDVSYDDQCPPSFFMRKLGCMWTAGKTGLIEGSLTGVFFGGAWGLYRYTDVYLAEGAGGDAGDDSNKKSGRDADTRGSKSSKASEGSKTSRRSSSGNQNNEEDTINDNVIFVSACNCAIVVGVICTLVNCTKAAIFC